MFGGGREESEDEINKHSSNRRSILLVTHPSMLQVSQYHCRSYDSANQVKMSTNKSNHCFC